MVRPDGGKPNLVIQISTRTNQRLGDFGLFTNSVLIKRDYWEIQGDLSTVALANAEVLQRGTR